MLLRLPLHHPAGGPPPRDKLGEDQACGSPRRRTRGSARRSNGRRPVRWCSNRTSVAARLSVRTPDGESRETVRSALWHRGATAKTSWTGLARVLAVIPSGLAPLLNCGCRSLPLPMSFGVGDARRQASTGRQAEARSEAQTAHRTRCGQTYNRYGSFCQDLVWVGSGKATFRFAEAEITHSED